MKKHGKRRIIKKPSINKDKVDNYEDDPGSPIR